MPSGYPDTRDDFIRKVVAIHGEKYDYSLVVWRGSRTKIEVLCRRCEKSWWVTPCNHLHRKSNCPRCSGHHRHTRDEYIELAQVKHNDLYDYSHITHFQAHLKAELGCKRCGFWFYQDLTQHLHGNDKRGSGCPRCAREVKASSRYEIEWLDKLGVPLERRQYWITLEGRNVCVDALWQNVAYEFLGKFWHGDPREYDHNKMNTLAGATFGELYTRTLKRLDALNRYGFEICYVWEKDYRNGCLISSCHPVVRT